MAIASPGPRNGFRPGDRSTDFSWRYHRPPDGQGAGTVGDEEHPGTPSHRRPAVAFLPWGDRFEDFHDKVGISLEAFRDELTGTWLFNYVEALQLAGLQPVLYFFSARVGGPVRFRHRPTGAPVRVLPTPWLHRKLQAVRDRLRIRSALFSSVRSYVATPWRALIGELRRDGCQAILCQEYEYPRFDGAVILGRVLDVPVFATYQGGNRPGSAVERLVRPSAIRRATGLVIASRAEVQRVSSTYGVPIDRIAVIPNAFDVRRWRPVDRGEARSALGIPISARVAAWHGRVEIHSKGLDVLLDAWEQVWASHAELRPLLLLVGSGQDRDALKRRVAELPPDAVRWEERWLYDRHLLWRYLSAADIAVLASRHEGFAVAVVEAMACGLPVVATDVSGVPEALGDDPAGLIVPPEDAAGLAAAITRLFEDSSLRAELGVRAHRRAEEHFSLQAVGDQLRAFLEDRSAVGAGWTPEDRR